MPCNKDHERREFANRLTVIANKYAGTQQLRVHIAKEIKDTLGLSSDELSRQVKHHQCNT